jgi:hypothetical protein
MNFTNLQLLQRISRVERVTGIEPALSAWELFELMGSALGSLRVSRSRAVWCGLWMPAVMARQWHANGTVQERMRRFESTPQNESPTLRRLQPCFTTAIAGCRKGKLHRLRRTQCP